ncbi:MAG: hypothetical protein AAF460_18195 [Pseudomonadota bacterium]
MRAAAAAGLSVVATAESSIVGCAIAVDAATEYALAQNQPPSNAISALLQALRATAPKPRPGACLLVDMAVVDPDHTGQGTYTAMRSAVHDRARAAGYRSVRGELSSTATQRVCVEHLGHRVLGAVHYAGFAHDGLYPFAAISDPASILLVEGAL